MRKLLCRSTVVRTARGLGLQGGLLAVVTGALFATVVPVALAADGAGDAGASAPSAAPAAGTRETELDEIVVTARKRSESIQDIPASVIAIPASAIKENHMTKLDDLGSVVSNLNIFEAHDNTPAVVMRGVGSFELVAGVGFYMNDIQLYEGQTVRPMDIERIEVLKGPQGTLYGGANIGGAIKYVTKDPTPTWENEVTGELGNYRTRNVAAVISGPIADKIGMRASVYDDNNEGYILDTYHDQTFGASHDRGGRLVFLAEPASTTNVRFSVNAESYTSENQNLQYKVTQYNASYLPYTADTYRYSVDDYFQPAYTRKLFSSALQVEHQFENGMSLNSITSQFWSYNRGITDFTKKPKPLDLLFQNQDHRVVSQELRLASSAHTSLDWLVGALVQQHKIDTTNSDLNFNGAIPATPTTCCDPAGDLTVPFDYDVQNKKQQQYALFGDATYYVGNWQYELGLRAEHYKSRLSAHNLPAGWAPGAVPVPTYFAPQELTGNKLSPRLSVQYRVDAKTNVYGTVARGFQPGDLSEQNLAITTIRAETATNYELGVKTKLPHGIQLNGAIYLVDYKDRWYQNLVQSPVGPQDITTNVGPSRNTGIEVEFLVPLTTEFKLSGGMGTTRAVWGNVNYYDPQRTAALAAAGGSGNVFTNLNGLTAPFTPAYTANLAIDWNRTLSSGYKVGARLDGTAVGQSYWNPNDIARQKAYQLMNAGAHIDAGNWTWIAHVSNLTGTKFNTMYWDATDVGVPDNHSFARINRPRMYALSGTYRF